MRMNLSNLIALLGVVGSVRAVNPTAVIDIGEVIGTTTAVPSATAVVNKFLGIPFAVSPPKRFTPPVPAERLKAPLKVQSFQPACIQQFNFPAASRNFTLAVFNTADPVESEDCLTLNVYASSAPPPPGGRAVMFWIYGGALQFGTAGQPAYDGSHFAALEDIVLVAANYRTNVFGFPGSPQIRPAENNLGFLDQRLALDWTVRNVHAFGGNPEKITIFGESAGAVSVDAMLTTTKRGEPTQFRAAILESGQDSFRPPAGNSVAAWNKLASLVGCAEANNLSCVAAVPATTIKNAIEMNELAFNPIADNVTMVSDPIFRRANKQLANIPILAGTNAQEGRVFEFGMNDTEAFVQATFPELSSAQQAAIITAFPLGGSGFPAPGTFETQFDQLSAIDTLSNFQCPAALHANATAATGTNTWRYFFNATFPNLQSPAFPNGGIFHSTEITMVFRSFNQTTATAQQEALANTMQNAWAGFARNPEFGPGWNKIGSGDTFADTAADQHIGVFQIDGVQVEQQSLIDARCAVIAPVFAGLEAAQDA